MPITTNLHSALVRLRYLDKPRVLWRDGICTNLKDNSERGKQVRRMGIFYQYAEQVIVYLGEASGGSHELLPWIETIHSKVVPLPYGLPLPEVTFEQCLTIWLLEVLSLTASSKLVLFPTELAPSPTDPYGIWNRDLSIVVEALVDLSEFITVGSFYKTQGDVRNAAWRALCCNIGIHPGSEAPDEFREYFQAVIGFASIHAGSATEATLGEISEDWIAETTERRNLFLKRSAPFCLRRRCAVASKGWAAQVPLLAEPGDAIFIRLGSAVPYFLRPGLDGYQLVGECYVHGLMKGEVLEMEDFIVEDVTLV